MICKICTHPRRVEIDRALVRGGNCAELARNFAVPYDSLWRHSRDHISRQLATAMEKMEVAEQNELITMVRDMLKIGKEVVERNHEKQNDAITLKGLSTLSGIISMLQQTVSSYMQAKLAEKELKGYDTNEDHAELSRQYEKDLSILSSNELKVLQKIQLKLRKQDPGIKAVPDGNKRNWYVDTDYEDIDPVETSTDETDDLSVGRIKRTKYHYKDEIVQENGSNEVEMDSEGNTEGETEPDCVVRPIIPTLLTSTPWSESELNPRRRY